MKLHTSAHHPHPGEAHAGAVDRRCLLDGAMIALLSFMVVLRAQAGNPVLQHLGGDFTLESVQGQVSLADFRRKVDLIYFGYTRCPDICQSTLADMAAAIDSLPEAVRTRIQPIFISLDPQRDTPASLSKYVDYFYQGMRGLTGSPATLSKVARRYGVSYRKVEDRSSAMGYTLDHSAYVYVLDQDGRISALLPYGSSVDDFVVKIEACLEPR
jgi:protein SCO1